MSTLIVSATAVEASHVPDGFPVLVTGMGKTAAAARLSRELTRRPEITRIINIGSAGALHDHLTGVQVIGKVIHHDISAEAIRALGYEVEDELLIDSASPIRLATGDVFVTDPAVRARLAQRADLVDMEGFALAWTARLFDVGAVLVKHVSDNADETAHDWVSAVEHSARELGAWLKRNV